MPFNGAGVYSPPATTFPEVNGTLIDAVRYNTTLSDIASGISQCLTKNGENTPTTNLPMGNFKHTGAEAAAGAGEYVIWGQAVTLGVLTADQLSVSNTSANNRVGQFASGPTDTNYKLAAYNGASGSGTGTVQATFGLEYMGTGEAAIMQFKRGAGAQDGSITFRTNAVDRLTISTTAVTSALALAADSLSATNTSASSEVFSACISPADSNFRLRMFNGPNSSAAGTRVALLASYHTLGGQNGYLDFLRGAGSTDGSLVIGVNAGAALTISSARDVTAGAKLSIPAGEIVSGTYTPTITSVTNVDAASASLCQYMRVGAVVTVSGEITIDPTSTVLTEIGISLPIASNIAAPTNVGGTGSSTTNGSGHIYGDATNDRAEYRFIAANTGSLVHYIHFTYRII